MKTALRSLAILLIAACQTGAASIDDNPGFRDLVFGQDQSTITGLSAAPLDPEGNVRYYKRDADSLLVEGIRAEWVIYGFSQEKLSQVLIAFGHEADTSVLKTFATKWGNADKESERSEAGARHRHTWTGKKLTATLVFTTINMNGSPIPTGSSLTLSAGLPTRPEHAAPEFDGTFDGVRVGDTFAEHKSKFDVSPADSNLPGYKGKTYCSKTHPCAFAGVPFNFFDIGVEAGVIEQCYFWLRTTESKLEGYRKQATESLNQFYAKSGVSMTERLKGPTNYERAWVSPESEAVLKTVIDGTDPLSDRWATVEIFITKHKNKPQPR